MPLSYGDEIGLICEVQGLARLRYRQRSTGPQGSGGSAWRRVLKREACARIHKAEGRCEVSDARPLALRVCMNQPTQAFQKRPSQTLSVMGLGDIVITSRVVNPKDVIDRTVLHSLDVSPSPMYLLLRAEGGVRDGVRERV